MSYRQTTRIATEGSPRSRVQSPRSKVRVERFMSLRRTELQMSGSVRHSLLAVRFISSAIRNATVLPVRWTPFSEAVIMLSRAARLDRCKLGAARRTDPGRYSLALPIDPCGICILEKHDENPRIPGQAAFGKSRRGGAAGHCRAVSGRSR